jgi:hypothetical protein
MRFNPLAVCALFLLAVLVAPALAEDERDFFRGLRLRSGAIALQDRVATLELGPRFPI